MKQVASPDRWELVRLSCPDYGFAVASAIWCRDSGCCAQDPRVFLESLVAAREVREIPVFAVRYAQPDIAGPDTPVIIWRAGELTPAFIGPLAGGVRFQLHHACSKGPSGRPGQDEIPSPDRWQLQRLNCRQCGYEVAVAICRPGVDTAGVAALALTLVSAEVARGIPVFVIRYLNPGQDDRPGDWVQMYRAGRVDPVFAGPVAAAIHFQMRHQCGNADG